MGFYSPQHRTKKTSIDTATPQIPMSPSGIALFIDFRKAFDTIERDFINNCLEKFNFGPNIKNWVKILYNNVSSCVLNNGFGSEFFPVERGVRQGCPLSGLLFVIGIEILGRAIKKRYRSSMLRLDQAGNLTYFYLKVKHLSILPETWQVVWYRYY